MAGPLRDPPYGVRTGVWLVAKVFWFFFSKKNRLLAQWPRDWTISSVIFLASPKSIMVLLRKKSSLSTPA